MVRMKEPSQPRRTRVVELLMIATPEEREARCPYRRQPATRQLLLHYHRAPPRSRLSTFVASTTISFPNRGSLTTTVMTTTTIIIREAAPAACCRRWWRMVMIGQQEQHSSKNSRARRVVVVPLDCRSVSQRCVSSRPRLTICSSTASLSRIHENVSTSTDCESIHGCVRHWTSRTNPLSCECVQSILLMPKLLMHHQLPPPLPRDREQKSGARRGVA
mmetsp:Transcript_13008/g.29635  ORF Transcript_13008/g.29635 Transcript_13008/m.29635 type:complete len:218 (-) Transcript_13008:856-1509(-)